MKSASTILTIGLAVAVGAAIYFIFQEIQNEKKKVEALSQHIRRLESLVWTYNIRPRPSGDHTEVTETEVSEDIPDHGDFTDGEGEQEDQVVQFPPVISVMSFAPPQHQHQHQHQHYQPQDDHPQIEEIPDDEPVAATIPDVVSFDTSKQHNSDPVTVEEEHDSPSHSDADTIDTSILSATPQSNTIVVPVTFELSAVATSQQQEEVQLPSPVETVVVNSEDNGQQDGAVGTRVYTNTAKNRKLGRVGKTY